MRNTLAIATLLALAPMTLPAQTGAPWGLQLGVEQSWNSSVQFGAPEDPGDFETQLSLRVRRLWSGQRGGLSLTGEGGGSIFAELTEFNQASYAGQATGMWDLSPRTTVSADGRVRSSYLGDLTKLTYAGAISPLTVTHTRSGVVRLSHEASRRTTLLVEGNVDDVTFDSETLAGGTTVLGRATLRQLMSRRDTLSLGVDGGHSDLAAESTNTVNAGLAWDRVLLEGLTLTVSGGAAWYRANGILEVQLTPVASIGFESHGRRGGIGARYSRVVEPAYGLGRVRSSDLGSLHWEQNFGRAISTSLVAEYRGLSDSLDPNLSHARQPATLKAGTLTAILKWRVASDLTLSTTALHRQRFESTGAVPMSAQTVSVGVTYSPGLP